jgi:hypothetical protein
MSLRRVGRALAVAIGLAACGGGNGGGTGSVGGPAPSTQDPAPPSGHENPGPGQEPPGFTGEAPAPGEPGGAPCVPCGGTYECTSQGQGTVFVLQQGNGQCLVSAPGQQGSAVLACDGSFTDPSTGKVIGQWVSTGGGDYNLCIPDTQNGRMTTVCIACMPAAAATPGGTGGVDGG